MIELKINVVIKSMQEIIDISMKERKFVLTGNIVNSDMELKFDWQVPGETLGEKRQIFNALIDYSTTRNGHDINEVIMSIEIKEIKKYGENKYSIRLINDFNHLLKVKELYTLEGKNINELLENTVITEDDIKTEKDIIDNTNIKEKENEYYQEYYGIGSEIDGDDYTIDVTEQIEETREEHITQDNSNIVEETEQINNTNISEKENDTSENNLDNKETVEETEQVSTVKTDVIADETEHTEENIITEDSKPEKTLNQLYEDIQHRDDFNSTALNNFIDKAVPVDSEIKNLLKVIVLNSTMIKDSYKTFLNKFNKLQSMGTRNEIILFTQFNGYGISNSYVKMKYIDVMNNLKEKYEIGAIEQGIQQVYSKLVEMESEENKND
ncbi:hypothetical protein ACFPVV_07065 [Macrococcoides bohemicum]|uniref:Uncharacterized protein n=1 Tax=Macrococcoides bohemicum TaxID=1903056 RepID=A0A328A2J1_9STAP|nr:hypothetical protein [Macrococcus bohemicus]RAK47658.1 hypothetical protein BHX94_12430 [Macrococcus bohemicus]